MPFRELFQDLMHQHPEVLGVIFCDEEGEMVDLARVDELDTFEFKVLGATAALWIQQVARISEVGTEGLRLQLRGARRIMLFEGLPDHYYLLLVARPGTPVALLGRALHHVALATRAEM